MKYSISIDYLAILLNISIISYFINDETFETQNQIGSKINQISLIVIASHTQYNDSGPSRYVPSGLNHDANSGTNQINNP